MQQAIVHTALTYLSKVHKQSTVLPGTKLLHRMVQADPATDFARARAGRDSRQSQLKPISDGEIFNAATLPTPVIPSWKHRDVSHSSGTLRDTD